MILMRSKYYVNVMKNNMEKRSRYCKWCKDKFWNTSDCNSIKDSGACVYCINESKVCVFCIKEGRLKTKN